MKSNWIGLIGVVLLTGSAAITSNAYASIIVPPGQKKCKVVVTMCFNVVKTVEWTCGPGRQCCEEYTLNAAGTCIESFETGCRDNADEDCELNAVQ